MHDDGILVFASAFSPTSSLVLAVHVLFLSRHVPNIALCIAVFCAPVGFLVYNLQVWPLQSSWVLQADLCHWRFRQ